MHDSLSWRVTGPVRRIADWLGSKTGLVFAAVSNVRNENDLMYAEWLRTFDILGENERQKIADHIEQLPYRPLISILMPVYNTPEKWLRLAIDSVRAQLYPNWELCIADDASTASHVRPILEEYQSLDPRIRGIFRTNNGHISAASNSALELATGDYVALLDHDDELTPDALYMIAVELNRYPDADIVYSDEDKIDEDGCRFQPFFKPDWNPDLFYSQNYICHLAAYRRSLVGKVGGFREGFEGSQDYDLCLRCSAASTAANIRHITKILYHWRAIKGSTAVSTSQKSYAENAGIKALKDHFAKIDPKIEVSKGDRSTTYFVTYPLPSILPLVSIIIPTRDCVKVLKTCVSSIIAKTSYKNFELIIVDNQSAEPETIRYFSELRRDPRIRILPYDAPFNYSAVNNYAVRQAQGDLICLCNNDLEVISADWLTTMVRHAIRPEIGAVGAKLYYPDGRIQHGGVVLGIGGVAGHAYQGSPKDYVDVWGRLILPQGISAVTAACLMVRKEIFTEVGGLDEKNLAVAFNDIDFCLKVREAGYRNLWTPMARLYHHESYSRGHEDTPEKKARFEKEIEYMQQRWGALLFNDPYYNPNLTLEMADFSLAWPPRVDKPWEEARS
ncbi:glycosyltransferase family 2 protein [Geobacter argillaceus]|nr:glycosyltransferase family 2 protein [Geobacter argillaceus]